jgi:hypothetical protein
MGALPPLALLLVDGRVVVEDGQLQTADAELISREAITQARRLHKR